MRRLIERLLSCFGGAARSKLPLILPPWEIESSLLQGRITSEMGKMAGQQRLEAVQHWTGKGRAAFVISLLKDETTAAEAAQRHGLKVAEVEEWRGRFLLGAENAIGAQRTDDEGLHEEEINRLKRKVGELMMDLDILLLD